MTTRFFTVAVAGHVDHGKTTLVRALTGIDTDRMGEEKRRGVSIESGVALLGWERQDHVALVDVPGHKDYLKNTIRGLSGVDLAILVVAADDGVMPQTRDHLDILTFFGAKGGLVVISKSDLVDSETLELAELEIRELVRGTFLDSKEVCTFSSKQSEKAEFIHQALSVEVKAVQDKRSDQPLRLWIDQIRQITGFGAVVSGTLVAGEIRRGDALELMPTQRQTRARFIESHGKRVDRAQAGQRIGVNLHHIGLDDLKRGMLLCAPSTFDISFVFNAEFCMLGRVRGVLKNRMRVKLHCGTLSMPAMMVIMDRDIIEPGGVALVQFRLSEGVCLVPNDRFVVSLLNINGIVGGGRVLDISREKFTRSRVLTMLPPLKALQRNDSRLFVESVLELRPTRQTTPEEIHRRSGICVDLVKAMFEEEHRKGRVMVVSGDGVLLTEHVLALKVKALDALRRVLEQNGLKSRANAAEIIAALDVSVSEAVGALVLRLLVDEHAIVKDADGFFIPGLRPGLTVEQDDLADSLLAFARTSGYMPFSASRFVESQDRHKNIDQVRKMMHFLHHQRRLVRLTNKRFLGNGAVEEIKTRVGQYIRRNGHVSVADSQDILGYGRTMAVPVFEYLDAVGFTRRTGDVRVLAEAEDSAEVRV
jgi:selenocysteine-specific elongation factor